MDMVVTTAMVTLLQGQVISVAHNPLHITNVIMHIDTSHKLHGELEETVLEKVTEVLEVVKV